MFHLLCYVNISVAVCGRTNKEDTQISETLTLLTHPLFQRILSY